MCGIAGKIHFNGKSITPSELTAMAQAIVHRGPDDSGIHINAKKNVGLAHRRLSIIDLSPLGRQPMSYLNRYWIVFNGEIYNYQEERAQLLREGYRFTSQTDTEVIMALYDRYGRRCLDHLRGMFAFALYDSQAQTLFCARDRLGKKPFKYYADGTCFMFASELKALLTQAEYHKKPDLTAIHHYLTLQYCPAPYTGFEGIQKLAPGHYLWIDIPRAEITKTRYWHLQYQPNHQLREAEWIEVIRDQLKEAVKLRMVADVPVGAFLSGGVDSSAVVATMSKLSAQSVKTFSIGFKEQAFNELAYARLVAETYRTDHTEFMVEPDALEILPQLVGQYEEPYADSSAVPTYYLSKLTRQHVTVALNGDGGDENFAGYSRYNIQKFAVWCDRVGLSRLPLMHHVSHFLAQNLQSTFWHRLHRFASTLPRDFRHRYVNYICYFTNPMKAKLYQPAYQDLLANDTYGLIAQEFRNARTRDPLNQTLYADFNTYLPEDLLVKVDLASMMNSLEARSPLLDHKFIETMATIPFNLKLKGWWSNKYIFKKSLQGIIPPAILQRPKMGFVVPIERWFRGDIKAYLKKNLLTPNGLTSQLFNRPAVEELVNLHTKTRVNMAPPLWALLTLELWYKHYFDS